mmetsp:Transcript_113885/g.317101  ORF Transcript_113885/g.317101 Transcript_113885/m.317101 type:complete len:229 (-) Transcript_113885:76-762(-)
MPVQSEACSELPTGSRAEGVPRDAPNSNDHKRSSTKRRAPRPVLRAGVAVVAQEKMKWKKGGIPMPAGKRGSAFKVSPGAIGVIVGINPLRVNWGSGHTGLVRGDQIRWHGAEDTFSSGLSALSTGFCNGLRYAPSTVSGDTSTATGDTCSHPRDDLSVTSGQSSVPSAMSVGVRQIVKHQYWGRQVQPRSGEPVLCTGGVRRLLLGCVSQCFLRCSPACAERRPHAD